MQIYDAHLLAFNWTYIISKQGNPILDLLKLAAAHRFHELELPSVGRFAQIATIYDKQRVSLLAGTLYHRAAIAWAALNVVRQFQGTHCHDVMPREVYTMFN